MKKTILLFLTSIALFSCSNNDDSSQNASDVDFNIPINIGNYWTYDIDSNNTMSRDSLYVSENTTINSVQYKKLKTRNDAATGFYSSSLRNNNLRVDNQLILLTGSISIGQNQTLPIGLDLSLDNFIIFKKNATNGELLSTKTGTFNQTVNNIPLTIEYTLRSEGGLTLASFTSPNNDLYQDVKSTKVILNLKVTTTQTIGGFPVTITILQPQDVLISTQYLAKNIGVVHTNTITTYTIDSSIASQFGIPPTNTQTQNEYLDVYSVN